LSRFSEGNVAYALIGGYAVGIWGVPRGTVDMDFLVPKEDMTVVREIMSVLGYQILFSSENVTQFTSTAPGLGEIDFLHAFRPASLAMLKRAVDKRIFSNGVTIKVLLPEDLIGLKVQAMSNNDSREHLDRYDIETLMKLHGRTMDWQLIEGYFALFELLPLFTELKEKYHAS